MFIVLILIWLSIVFDNENLIHSLQFFWILLLPVVVLKVLFKKSKCTLFLEKERW
jgi:hypothetical protein